MSGDTVCSLPVVRDRLQKVRKTCDRLHVLRDQLQVELAAREVEVQNLDVRVERLTKIGELFRMLLDRLVMSQVSAIEGLCTDGLQAIFHDQKLVFESEVGTKYNKVSIEFFFRQGSGPTSIRGEPLDSFGGGPASIVSLTLRVLALLKTKRYPILLLDETLAAVSDDYVDATGEFLQKLATTTGIDILLVTHKQSFLEHSDLAYRGIDGASDGSSRLELQQIRG